MVDDELYIGTRVNYQAAVSMPGKQYLYSRERERASPRKQVVDLIPWVRPWYICTRTVYEKLHHDRQELQLCARDDGSTVR